MRKDKKIKAVMILLSLHLLYCNADLLIINAGLDLYKLDALSMVRVGWLLLVAVSYSVLSSMSVVDVKQKWPVVVFAIFDAVGVLIQKYDITSVIGFYFAAYTCWMIIMIWMMFNKPDIADMPMAEEEESEIDDDAEYKAELKSWYRRIAGKMKSIGTRAELIAFIVNNCENERVKETLLNHYREDQQLKLEM